MTEHWWQRLFSDPSDEDEHADSADLPNGSVHFPPVGRFEDKSRRASVRMLARYPGGRQEKTVNDRERDGKPFAQPQHRAPAPPSLSDLPKHEMKSGKKELAAAKKNKAPFHLTRVPSPVFGFREPPANFYKPNKTAENEYLTPDKEATEKKQVDENRKMKNQKSSADPFNPLPGPDLQIPTIQRQLGSLKTSGTLTETSESLSENKKKPEIYPSVVSVHQENGSGEGEKGSGAAYQQVRQDERIRTVPGERPAVPVASRLPRSPHRPGGTSNVPFNVLMFHSDYHASAPRQQVTDDRLQSHPSGLRLPLELLDDPPEQNNDTDQWITEKKKILEETLSNFHVSADIIGFVQGPSVTRIDIRLHPGVKINKVVNLTEDIKLNLAVRQIRIAPVPGKSAVGIEIPNRRSRPVVLKEIIRSASFAASRAPLTAALGEDVSGNHVLTNLAKMPHGLIAGATGSGKSVCIHSLIISLIYRTAPEDLRFLLVDPKVVELAPYRHLPHLAAPVLTEPREAALALKWAVEEMENRYQRFAGCGVRDIDGYNERQRKLGTAENHLPYLVIIIDELADLMMAAPQDVEESVCRIAQKARAAGIHLLLATQRPSVDVITGLIKSNIPTRIAFSVSSQTDSRTIIDSGGAERLIGKGDMLFAENGARSLKRLQGCFVSDEEINRVTQAFSGQSRPDYLFLPDEFHPEEEENEQEDDALLSEAAYYMLDQGQASVSSIQRHFRIGYNRAARLIDELEKRRVITPANGSKPRQVLVTREQLQKVVPNPS